MVVSSSSTRRQQQQQQQLHRQNTVTPQQPPPQPQSLQQQSASQPGMRLQVSRGFDTDKYERIDRIAMWLFPIIFFIFNICYWSYYLVLNELLPELW